MKKLTSVGFDQEANLFHRYIIPTQKNSSQLQYYVKTTGYKTDNFVSAIGRLVINIDQLEFTLFETKYNKNYYFIIECNSEIDFHTFSNICHVIMIGFGFLSSNFIQDEAYYLQARDEKHETILGFSYSKLRPSIDSKGTCNPIYSNPRGYTQDESIIQKVGSELEIFDPELFSMLCSKIYKEQDYAVLILLILETNIASLILRPAGYSVALEKITNILTKESKELKPIPDKSLSNRFYRRLTASS